MQKPIDLLRAILLPFSWCYGLIVFIRNKFYDFNIFDTEKFRIPVICIGNITVGGTGKTPHVEYLLRKYHTKYKIAVLSRGYGRKTKGFRYVNSTDTASLVGDESLQMKQKFSQITFAVDENRRRGIHKLQKEGYNLVLLDDAFQHRAVNPTKSILLMDYNRLPFNDFYLPTGNLRDGLYSVKRADCILITKCPYDISDEEKNRIIKRNGKGKNCFFTHFQYADIVSYDEDITIKNIEATTILLVTGIANPTPLEEYLNRQGTCVKTLYYSDHYDFSQKDILKIKREFLKLDKAEKKIILTTEKDKVKLKEILTSENEVLDSWYYLPIRVEFSGTEDKKLEEILGL